VDRAPEERNITVYTNCDKLTLVVNGAEVETKEAVDHCIVFENVALRDGENTITAKCGCCSVEDTIILNGVAEHNAAYTLPDIAAAMAVGNWFDEVTDNEESDEIVVTEGYYSIEDPFGVLAANEECAKCIKGWFMAMGNLTMASMIGAIAGMMGDARITMLQSMMDGVTMKDFAKLNRLLSRIKK
jgi:beta-galactosidase